MVSPSSPTVAKGIAQQFTAAGTYADGLTQDITHLVTWASATPAVASISNTGLASSLGVGTSVITASLDGVTSPGDTLTVTPARAVRLDHGLTWQPVPPRGGDAAACREGQLYRRLDRGSDQFRDLGVGDAGGGDPQWLGPGFGPDVGDERNHGIEWAMSPAPATL